MAVDPQHSYSNESERANEDIYDDFKCKKILVSMVFQRFNPFKLEFTIVIFIHYKSRIAVAVLDL